MTSRDVFLAKIRKAQPSPVSRPVVPRFATPLGDRVSRFAAALTLMGGTCITLQALGDIRTWLADRFGPDAVIASVVPEIEGNRAINSQTLPASLEDVAVGIVRARFGVAETGSAWFSEDEYIVNAIGYLVQHLVVLLDPAQIEDGLQEAYRRPDFKMARYAALVTGPSATADIEGVMIRGAQGVRSLTIALVPRHPK
jgi:L-lactate dehydrogenase complex protein LldG